MTAADKTARWTAVSEIARWVTLASLVLLVIGTVVALVDDRSKLLAGAASVPFLAASVVWLVADWMAVAASRADR